MLGHSIWFNMHRHKYKKNVTSHFNLKYNSYFIYKIQFFFHWILTVKSVFCLLGFVNHQINL